MLHGGIPTPSRRLGPILTAHSQSITICIIAAQGAITKSPSKTSPTTRECREEDIARRYRVVDAMGRESYDETREAIVEEDSVAW